jgi:hypothetical protein
MSSFYDFECPHCEAKYRNAFDYFDGDGDSDVTKVDCDCGETFFLRREMSVDYSTEKES